MPKQGSRQSVVWGPFLNLWQHIDVEQDWGKRLYFGALSKNLAQHIDVEQDPGAVNAYALRPSLNLSQHIDVKQNGKGKPLCSAAFSQCPAAHRC